jgi:2-methylcitrate dehydratase PrpD
MRDLYFKRYACCRWAQPAIEGALNLTTEQQINPRDIKEVCVITFEEASHLTISRPANTEQAQYSLPYPVAAALITGKLDPQQVMPPTIFNKEILNLAESISIVVDEGLNERFPDETLARVILELRDGRKYESKTNHAPGDLMTPMSEIELVEKFNRIVGDYLPDERLKLLQEACQNAEKLESVKELVTMLSSPPDPEKNGGV